MSRIFILFFISILFINSCQKNTNSLLDEPVHVRIGELPIVDTLPLYVAQKEGLFSNEGLDVEIVTHNSAKEMNAELDAGELDGTIESIMAAVLANQEKQNVKIVRVAGSPSEEVAMFAILSSPNSGIVSSKDLLGKEIAISENTIIEFVATKLLEKEGISTNDITFIPIPKVPIRLEMLIQDQVDAITISEPLVSTAVQEGAHIIIDDKGGDFSLGVLLLSVDFINDHQESVRGFLKAYDEAVKLINEKPDKYKSLLAELNRVPENVEDQYNTPPFPSKSIPSEAQVKEVITWMLSKGIISQAPNYDEIVDDTYLH